MDRHSAFLGIHTGSQCRGGAEQHADISIVHRLDHLLALLLVLGLLDEAYFVLRNTIVFHELFLDLRKDVPLAGLVGREVAEDKLCSLLLVVPMVVFRDKPCAVAGLVVGIVTEEAGSYQSHVERGLPAGIGRYEHLSFLLPFGEGRTVDKFSVACLGELHQTLVEVLLVSGGLHVVQDDVHAGTVESYVLACTVVRNLIIEGGQLWHFHKIAEALFLYDGIGHVELIVGGLLRIYRCPCIEAVDALLRHCLRTQVLEQQVQFRQTVADGSAAQESSTQIFARTVLDRADGIEKVQGLLRACGIAQTRHALMAGRKGEVLELVALVNKEVVDAHHAEVHEVILTLGHVVL